MHLICSIPSILEHRLSIFTSQKIIILHIYAIIRKEYENKIEMSAPYICIKILYLGRYIADGRIKRLTAVEIRILFGNKTGCEYLTWKIAYKVGKSMFFC